MDTIADNTTTSYLDSTVADADLGSPLPLVNLTSSRPQFPKQVTMGTSFVSNATLTITATGVALLLATSAANANNGDYLDSDTGLLESGTYTVYIHARQETTAGKFDVYLDEVSIATGLECYAAASAAFLITIPNVAVVGSGYHKLRLKINGKHAS